MRHGHYEVEILPNDHYEQKTVTRRRSLDEVAMLAIDALSKGGVKVVVYSTETLSTRRCVHRRKVFTWDSIQQIPAYSNRIRRLQQVKPPSQSPSHSKPG
jgi:hypothetical protein